MVRFSPRQRLFRIDFENMTLAIQPAEKTQVLPQQPRTSCLALRQAIFPLTFPKEEAADQPSCPMLPNAGPKPLRPLLKAHLVVAPDRATPQVQVFAWLSGVARESLYRGSDERFGLGRVRRTGCSSASPPLRARYARFGTSPGRQSTRCPPAARPAAPEGGGSAWPSSAPMPSARGWKARR